MRDLPNISSSSALLLDFDGTLVDLCTHPDAVVLPASLHATLGRLATALDGAVAVISGRTLDSLAGHLDPLPIALAGIHGMAVRSADGRRRGADSEDTSLAAARTEIAAFVDRHPGLFHEDKGSAIALHYREAPAMAAEVEAFMAAQQARLGPAARLQYGKAVVELVHGHRDKGDAVTELMAAPPFAGRTPVYVGDDVTDEAALARVNELGGVSVHVGNTAATCARYRLDSPAAVRAWLTDLAAGLSKQ